MLLVERGQEVCIELVDKEVSHENANELGGVDVATALDEVMVSGEHILDIRGLLGYRLEDVVFELIDRPRSVLPHELDEVSVADTLFVVSSALSCDLLEDLLEFLVVEVWDELQIILENRAELNFCHLLVRAPRAQGCL